MSDAITERDVELVAAKASYRIAMHDLKQIAKQTIVTMCLDLGYSREIPPTYGWFPMRHTQLWDRCLGFIGDEAGELFDEIEKQRHVEETDPVLLQAKASAAETMAAMKRAAR